MTTTASAEHDVLADATAHDEPEHRRAANRAIGVSAIGLAATGGAELLLAAVTGSVAVPGVQAAIVRARWMGRSLLVDVEAQLDAEVDLAAADSIGRRVQVAINAAVPAARRVRFLPLAASPTAHSSRE